MTMPTDIIFDSLFAGIGGFDLGFERAGMISGVQVELDAVCNGVLGKHFPGANRSINDVRKFNRSTAEVICGGFPCQDISVAGFRAGLAGERSGLWFEFARIIEASSTPWVVIENVPGLLSSNGGSDFDIIQWHLVKCGYGVAWRVFDAQYFGIAQRRRRVFIVGHLGDGRAAEVLFESCGSKRNTAKSEKARADIADTVTSCFANHRGASAGKCTKGLRNDVIVYQYQGSNVGEFCALRRGNGGVTCGVPFLAGALQSHSKRHGHAMTTQQAAESNQLIAMTLAGHPPRFNGHEETMIPDFYGVRRLTPRDCERLQGFPDDWTRWTVDGKEVSDSARYRMLGNAVFVPGAEWIGRRIMACSE